MKCPKCQFENKENANFCEQCGCRLDPPAPSQASQDILMCQKCGAQIKDGARFCVKCGTAVGINEGQQGVPIQSAPIPPVAAAKKYEKKEQSGSGGLIIAAVILGVIALAAIGAVAAFMIFNSDLGNNVKKASAESEMESDTAKEKKDKNDPLQELLKNQQYTELIDALLAMEDVEFYGDEETMREYMRQAVVGHMNTAINEADELSASGDFEEAYGKIDEEIAYRNHLKLQGRVHPLTDDSTELTAKHEQITERYADYVYQKKQEKAEQKDLAGMETLLGQASGRFPEDEYNRVSREAYCTFVIKSVDQMQVEGKDPYTVMSFIDSYFEKTNYHGYLMEIWDNHNVQSGRVAAWDTSFTHADSNGYLLYNSNGRYINKSELGNFSQYELYLARWEIYARHNRIFVDSGLNTYYSKYGWYNGTTNYSNFDESVLNEYEKGNIKTIIDYEKECGYR